MKLLEIWLLLDLRDRAIRVHSAVSCSKLDSRERKLIQSQLHLIAVRYVERHFENQINCYIIHIKTLMTGRSDVTSARRALLYFQYLIGMRYDAVPYAKFIAINVIIIFKEKFAITCYLMLIVKNAPMDPVQ
ncbi:hypothetical protein TNCV_2619871 [Trichonephila clavipes]|uniref:Uncharacterized protein n=1 Tax=Trichonephila clavipes TaxID=2585209 RepID=A0A8X6WJ40_TRICX|nr:hypothetical protein TNCV_2619871 [Trichonephila clavipes]